MFMVDKWQDLQMHKTGQEQLLYAVSKQRGYIQEVQAVINYIHIVI